MSVLGWPWLHLRRVDSTNARARALAAAGAPHGTLVTAGEQSAGRGRQGRTWSAPPGRSLLMSLVLRDAPALLSLAAGVAVAEVCEATVDRAAAIKWPNDVLLGEGKVAGILVEGRPREDWAVLGIGINVATAPDELPDEARTRAGTLGLAPTAIDPIRAELLVALQRWLAAPAGEMLDAVRARDALLGRPVRSDAGDGTGAGIDDAGRLLVRSAAGELTLDAGEVHLKPR